MNARINIIFLWSIVFCFFGCKDNGQTEYINTNAPYFTLSVKGLNPFTANIEISHTGSNRDRYFVYVNESLAADMNSVVDSLLNCLESLVEYNQRKRIISLDNLVPNSSYYLYVFSVDEDNHLYGMSNSIFFTTPDVDIDMTLEPSWKINWLGEVLHCDDYWTQVDVRCTNISEPFYCCLVPDSIFCKYNGNISQVAYYEILKAHKEAHEKGYENFFDMLAHVSISAWYQRDPGFYYFMVIGVDDEGLPSGKYRISERKQIDEYTMLPAYKQLLGKWLLSDNSGESAIITITAKKNNKTYNVKGWAKTNWPLVFNYDSSDDVSKISIHRQRVATDITFVSNQDLDSFVGNLNLEAWFVNSSGNKQRATTDSHKLAYCVNSSPNSYTIDASFHYIGLEESDYGLYYSIVVDGEHYSSLTHSLYTFPIKLRRI